MLLPVFWIWIPHRDPDPAFSVNTDPDPDSGF
jgi:hypothetical protein